jgi:hypothetical protein
MPITITVKPTIPDVPKIIMAIDPGTETSGVVWYNPSLMRVVRSDAKHDNQGLLDLLDSGVYGADVVIIEELTPAGQVLGKSTFATIRWFGKFEHAAGNNVQLVTRREVCRRLLGKSSVAKGDTHIRQWCVDNIGDKGTVKEPGPTFGVASHSWQALGLAAAWLQGPG